MKSLKTFFITILFFFNQNLTFYFESFFSQKGRKLVSARKTGTFEINNKSRLRNRFLCEALSRNQRFLETRRVLRTRRLSPFSPTASLKGETPVLFFKENGTVEKPLVSRDSPCSKNTATVGLRTTLTEIYINNGPRPG